MKKLTIEELTRLNALLDDSLQQASKDQLATCIKLLGTSLAQLKIRYQVDDDLAAQNFYDFVKELQESKPSDQLNELAAKTVVECATAMAVAKSGNNRENDESAQ
jgi:hypothetical protein